MTQQPLSATPDDITFAARLLEQIELFLTGAASENAVSAALPAEPAHPALREIRRDLLATLREERGNWDAMRPRFTLDAELLASFEWHSARSAHCREAVWERVRDYPFLDRNEIGAEVRRCLEDCPPYRIRGHHAAR